MGKVVAVCMSEKRGTAKQNKHSAVFVKDWGIKGDAHAGKWHRQISLLSAEKIEAFREKAKDLTDKNGNPFEIPFGAFGENLAVSGIDFKELPIGTLFNCGKVKLRLTQIGKQCHNDCEIFQRIGTCIMPHEGVFAEVLEDGIISEGDEMTVQLPFSAAVITISDSGSKGLRTDTSGPELISILEEKGYKNVYKKIISDDRTEIESLLISLADKGIKDTNGKTFAIDLIITTGGTGFSPRDNTPEATNAVCERLVPGIPEAMRTLSLKITPKAMLSRESAGIRKKTLIINVPGSPKGARENLKAVIDTVLHGLSILSERTKNCGKEL